MLSYQTRYAIVKMILSRFLHIRFLLSWLPRVSSNDIFLLYPNVESTFCRFKDLLILNTLLASLFSVKMLLDLIIYGNYTLLSMIYENLLRSKSKQRVNSKGAPISIKIRP